MPNFKHTTQIESKPNFSSLMDEAPTAVKFAAPIPVGSYVATVLPAWRQDTNQKGTVYYEFQLKLIEPFEDVDSEELKLWIIEHGDIGERLLKRRFFRTPDAIPFLDQFHKACGITLESGVSRLLRNDEVGNCFVGVYLKHRSYTDGSDRVAVEIDRFFMVSDE